MQFLMFLPLLLGFGLAFGAFDFLGSNGDDSDNNDDGQTDPDPSVIAGTMRVDELTGAKAPDTIRGHGGDDVLNGRGGDDQLFGQVGDDDLGGGDGDDLLKGGVGDDDLNGRGGDDLLFGQAGNDVLVGGGGDDQLDGGAGDDLLQGGSGDDLLDGGDGDDTLSGQADDDVLAGGGGDDQLDGGTGDDQLNGGKGDDVLLGGGHDNLWVGQYGGQVFAGNGDDRLDGGAGDDILYGQGGNDTLDGGDGDDRLFDYDGGDVLIGGDGADEFTVHFTDSDHFGSPVGDSGYVPTVIEDFDPSQDRLVLDGVLQSDQDFSDNPDESAITVRDWDDGLGADIYFNEYHVASVAGAQGMSPSDITANVTDWEERGGGVFHQIVATDEADDITIVSHGYETEHEPSTVFTRVTHFDPDSDLLTVDRSGDDITGLNMRPSDDGEDSLIGNFAVVEGVPDLDASQIALNFHGWNITGVTGSDRADVIHGYGHAEVDGAGGDDTLLGGVGSDILIGGAGNDTLDSGFSYDGVDVLDGGAGDDELTANIGATLTGGSGADGFTVQNNDSYGTDPASITDFDPAQDTLALELDEAGDVTVMDWADGLGANVLVDGVAVAEVTGGAGLTPADIAVTVG